MSPAVVVEGPQLLVASVVRDAPVPEDWRTPHADRLLLVFSEAVEPAGLQPRDFLVVRADGSRAWPVRAMLAPGSEVGEHRAVTLEGNFGRGDARAVQVVGALHGMSGASLEGLGAQLEALDASPRIVAYERVRVSASTCEGSASAVRTYWSRPLVDAPDAASVELENGDRVRAVAYDDIDGDNVLDLCFDRSLAGPPVGVTAAPKGSD